MTLYKTEVKTLNDTVAAAQDILNQMQHPLLLLKGELGAGKTTFVKALLRLLDVKDTGSSPSYAIINQYVNDNEQLYHIDLYRLNSADEVFQLGIEEILYSGDKCFIEWPEIIEEYIDPPYHILYINHHESCRELIFSKV